MLNLRRLVKSRGNRDRAHRLRQYLEHLLERAPRLLRGASPTLSPGQLAVTECDPSKARANNLERRRLVRRTKIEPRLRRNIGMTPAVDDDARDVAPGIEPRIAQHLLQLFLYLSL